MSDGIGDLWLYPLHWGDTLSNHDWWPLYGNRLLASDFVAHQLVRGQVGRAALGTAVLLWTESYRQDPAGTLPDDDVALARLAGFGADVEGWRDIRDDALYGWSRVMIDGDDTRQRLRLGHRMIATAVFDMHKRKHGREQARAEASITKLRFKVRAKLAGISGGKFVDSSQVVNAVVEWLRQSDLYCTDENVRAALEVAAGVPRVVPHRRQE